MVKYPQVFQKFNKLAAIPEEQWMKLEEVLTPLNFNKNEHIMQAGDYDENMYLITQGLTRSYYIDQEGKEFNKIFLAENEIASSYVEILQKIPSRLYIQTLEPTHVLRFSYKEIEKLYGQHPCWNELGRKIAENFFILKEQREYEFLLLDAKQRYLNFVKDYAYLKERIPQYHIAAYLGITPVSLSRVINSTKTT